MPGGVDDGGGGGLAGGTDEGEGWEVGGGEETVTVGATNCVRPGIWLVRLWMPRPTATPCVTGVAGPMPGIAAATGAFLDEAAGAADEMALSVPALVVTAVLCDGDPSGATPVAAIEIRLSVPVFCVGKEETRWEEEAVDSEATVSLDAPAMGNWGRLVSFRWGGRGAGALAELRRGVVDVPASAGMTSGACRWIKL